MNFNLHRGAESDLLEAARFYRREGGAQLAGRFLNEFERVLELSMTHPGFGTPTEHQRRAYPLKGLPYTVI